MTQLQRVVRSTQRRLWMRRWLHQITISVAIAAAALASVSFIQRGFALHFPMTLLTVCLCGLACLGSVIWLSLTRESEVQAAAQLDEAAGLRERISTAWFARGTSDPFAQAVVADAEHVSAGLSTRAHMRLKSPRPLGWAVAAVLACALTLLVPHGWLKRSNARMADSNQELLQTQVAVKREMESLKQLAEKSPALREFSEDLEQLDQEAGGEVKRPIDVRHEAVKKIDRLSDALKQKQEALRQEAAQEMRRLLRRVTGPEDKQAETEQLAQSLRQGDFKAAREELNAIKEKLAKLESEGDKEKVESLQKQLDELGKQIERAAEAQQEDKKLQQQLGIDDKTMQRLVEQLRKGDVDQARKELEKRGLTPEQAQKMADAMKQRQEAGDLAKKLGQAMKGSPQPGDPSAGVTTESLEMAEAQLSDLEMLDQQMSELDAALASLDQSRQSLDKPCSACKGTGKQGSSACSKCQGGGKGDRPGQGGMGKRAGQGEGGLAPEEATDVDFNKEKQKVASGKGSIIGQVLVEGDQIKGDLNPAWGETAIAAERDATDRINRDRVPRQYQRAVRNYFATMREKTDGETSATPAEEKAPPPGTDE
jgi:hypothetical protein